MNIDQRNTISRSHFLRSAAILAAGLCVDPMELFAQESPVITIKNAAAKAKIRVHPLRGNLHVLEGSGGNITVFNGPEGLLMVDAGIAVSQNKIMAALSGI